MANIAELHDNAAKVQWLVDRTRANGGLAPVDLERFWADQQVARADPFGKNIPQAPLGIMMSIECVFDELGMPEDWWTLRHDGAWRARVGMAYNDKAERIVGRRLLSVEVPDESRQYEGVGGLHDVFEARNEWHAGAWWLMQSAHNEEELKALLDRVEAKDIRREILPPDWNEQKVRLMPLGVKPRPYRSQRGPVTFAASIYGVENLIYLIMDNPRLAERLRDAILRVMLEIARVLDEEAGETPETWRHGFGFSDDQCYLLTPRMYEFFGYPIVKAIWETYSPDPRDARFQHSDSAMSHIVPVLGRLNLTGTNFGPTVTVQEIRRHMPKAVVQGQLAPFTFSRNDEAGMVSEFLRDYDQAKEKRGLLFSTAGSINNGSRLTGMRLIMSAIQHFGRYDR